MIRKQIIEKIYTEVFLYYLTLKEINTDYFINEIEKGIKTVSNKNNRTYVQGEMTDWTYFNRNKELHKVLDESFKYLKEGGLIFNCRLTDSWGIKMSKGNETLEHAHGNSNLSGLMYLNDCPIPTIFKEIGYTHTPVKGDLLFFNSMLLHKVPKIKEDITKYAVSFNFMSTVEFKKEKNEL